MINFLSAQELPRAHSTVYSDVRKGLLTAPVKVGPRKSAWPADEINQIYAARAAGWPEEEIKALVKALMAARQKRAPTFVTSD